MGIRFYNVSKNYGSKRVLEHFSHAFPDRGIVALMGPSGCGKTTLLRLVSGLESPDCGEIHVPKHMVPSVVFQEDRLLPTLTVRDNLLVVLEDLTREKRTHVDQCLDRLELLKDADRYPGQLSGGMRRRVALARSMVYGGNLILLDEPFKGLDARLKQQVMDYVLGERSENSLILMVTHDRSEAEQAQQILQLDGPPLRILSEDLL